MGKIKILFFTLFLTGVFILSSSIIVLAEEENVLNKFAVKAVPSTHQLNKKASYFDLLLAPNSNEKLTVKLENNTKETLTLEATINQAVTNQNGVVEYSGVNNLESPKSTYDITDLVTLSEKEISLKAGEKKELLIDVKMPDKKFSGILAGAVYVIEVPQKSAEGTIRNLLSREIAILLQTSEKAVEPDVIFNEARAIHNNERNAIEIDMENITPTYIKDVTLNYEIMLEGKPFLDGEKKSLKIAPNSMFPFIIPLEDKEFESGGYTAKVRLESGDKSWEETLSFAVKKAEAKQLNQTDVTNDESLSLPWSTIVLVAVLLIFILLVFYLIHNNQKLKKSLEKEKSHAKSKSNRRKRKK